MKKLSQHEGKIMHGFMKYTKVIVHEEKSADSEQVRREERKFSWNDFCFLVLGLPGQKHTPPPKKRKIKLNYYK